jgi:transcriptional regulator with XRE-family HTH domain
MTEKAMRRHLAEHFRAARIAKGWSLETLARQTGYGRAKKTARRIARFERDGRIGEELLARIADALDIDLATVEALLEGPFSGCYVLQRQAEGWFLTPEYLSWSPEAQKAQRCGLDEAKAIQAWLRSIGIRTSVVLQFRRIAKPRN